MNHRTCPGASHVDEVKDRLARAPSRTRHLRAIRSLRPDADAGTSPARGPAIPCGVEEACPAERIEILDLDPAVALSNDTVGFE